MIKNIISFVFTILLIISPAKADEISYDKADFVDVSQIINDAVYDIRYYSDYNFTGRQIDGYKSPHAYMTKESANSLKIAADNLRKQGYRILIWDTYRPQKAVNNFVRWINDPQDNGNKDFYPKLKKSDLVEGGYIATKSGHSRGSTVDLTIIKKDGSFVDMGGKFDLFDKRSNANYKWLTLRQYRNRQILRKVMLEAGFEGIDSEWWHFTLKNEPFPNTYFDFDVE